MSGLPGCRWAAAGAALALGLWAAPLFAQVQSNPSGHVDAARSDILAAAGTGDVEALKRSIAQGEDVNARGADGMAPLDLAAFRGDAACCRLLLAAGADAGAVDAAGMTPLHAAAFSGKKDVVQLLIEKGAAVNAWDRAGMTPLHYAAANGNTAVLTFLLSAGADVQAKTQEGLTPGALAAKNNQQAAADFLRAREALAAPSPQAAAPKASSQPRVYTDADLEALKRMSVVSDETPPMAPAAYESHSERGSRCHTRHGDTLNALYDEKDRLTRQKRDEEDNLPQLQKACDDATTARQGGDSNIVGGPGWVSTSNGYESDRSAKWDQVSTCRPLKDAQHRIGQLEKRIAELDRKISGQRDHPRHLQSSQPRTMKLPSNVS